MSLYYFTLLSAVRVSSALIYSLTSIIAGLSYTHCRPCSLYSLTRAPKPFSIEGVFPPPLDSLYSNLSFYRFMRFFEFLALSYSFIIGISYAYMAISRISLSYIILSHFT
jgi:hypothetical protein